MDLYREKRNEKKEKRKERSEKKERKGKEYHYQRWHHIVQLGNDASSQRSQPN